MNNNKLLLVVAAILLFVGLGKSNLTDIFKPNKPVSIDVLELSAPTDPNLLKEANDVVSVVKDKVSPEDAKRLRDLYLDIKQLIKLDGDDRVIQNTDEIRQANSLAGPMLRLDMKGKYTDLAKECKEVIVAAIGDDHIVLTDELRGKATDGFDALAWAFNEGSK